MVSSKSHSCLGCEYYDKGNCAWFVVKKGYSRPKKVPIDLRKKGCSHQLAKEGYNGEHSKLINRLVELFNGEFV
jgi:hypothetical protein